MLVLIKMQQKHLRIWLYLLPEEINGDSEQRKYKFFRKIILKERKRRC